MTQSFSISIHYHVTPAPNMWPLIMSIGPLLASKSQKPEARTPTTRQCLQDPNMAVYQMCTLVYVGKLHFYNIWVKCAMKLLGIYHIATLGGHCIEPGPESLRLSGALD